MVGGGTLGARNRTTDGRGLGMSTAAEWRRGRWFVMLAGIGLAVAAVAWPGFAGAQLPGSGPGPRVDTGVRGDAPAPGGMGLMVAERAQDRERIMLHLQDRDCEPLTLALLTGGRWLIYIPGAPARLQSEFPAELAAGTPFFVRCRDAAPTVVRVGATDSGATVSLEVGQRLRLTLESNPMTGYSWLITERPEPASSVLPGGAPDPAVLTQVLGPIFVPGSGLIGAGGTETFDFVAVGVGTTEISMEYARPFEVGSATDSWSIMVSVAP